MVKIGRRQGLWVKSSYVWLKVEFVSAKLVEEEYTSE